MAFLTYTTHVFWTAARKFGKYSEAMDLINKAQDLNPDSELATVFKVHVFMDQQKWKEAFEAVNDGLAKFPGNSSLSTLKQKIVDESDRPITAVPQERIDNVE
jgi:tetratricopeptide (TPR) repeat protein